MLLTACHFALGRPLHLQVSCRLLAMQNRPQQLLLWAPMPCSDYAEMLCLGVVCPAPVSSPPQNASHVPVCYTIGVVCGSCMMQMPQGLYRSTLCSFLSALLGEDFAELSPSLRRPC